MSNPNYEMAQVISEFDGKVGPLPTNDSKFMNSISLNGVLLSCAGLVLLVSNMWLFQPYLTSICLAFLMAIPLHSVRTRLENYFKSELEGRAKNSTFSFILLCVIKGFSQIILGEYTTNLFLSNLSFYLGLDYLDPSIKKSDIKKEEVEMNGGTSSRVLEESKDEEMLDLRFQTNGLDNFCSSLATTDWFYIVQVVRAATIFYSFNFLFHYSLSFIVISIILFSTYKFSKQLNTVSPKLQNILNTGSSLGITIMKKINNVLCNTINNGLTDSLTSFLVLSITFGLIYLVTKLLLLTIGEFSHSTKILIEKGSKFVYHETKDLSGKLISEYPELNSYQQSVKENVDNWFQSNNYTDINITHLSEYFHSDEFWTKLEDLAPNLYNVTLNNYHVSIRSLSNMSSLTQLVEETKNLGVFLVEKFNLHSLSESSLAGISFGPIATLLVGKVGGLSLGAFLKLFDLLFQLIVYITTLSYLVGRKEEPYQPIRKVFYKVTSTPFNLHAYQPFEKDVIKVIQGLWLTTFQMGLYHLLLAIVTFHLFSAPHPYYFSFIAFVLAVIPLGGPHFAAITPCAYMYWVMGKTYSPILLFLTQYFATSWADPHFYKHIPKLSTFATTLAMFLGFMIFGLKGVLLGPFSLALLPILYQHYVAPEEPLES
ncbi:hypothetical protein K502DRAFT_323316 [Neoconidiobolus thromboides FSU 785]|nr:hypothetical protein K502DRAFT_323316 [Neoconidiobolus thromboides FSU 785]